MESAQCCHAVRLYVYDLSRGLARRLSPVMLGNLHFMALYGGSDEWAEIDELYLYCTGLIDHCLSPMTVGPVLPYTGIIVTDIQYNDIQCELMANPSNKWN